VAGRWLSPAMPGHHGRPLHVGCGTSARGEAEARCIGRSSAGARESLVVPGSMASIRGGGRHVPHLEYRSHGVRTTRRISSASRAHHLHGVHIGAIPGVGKSPYGERDQLVWEVRAPLWLGAALRESETEDSCPNRESALCSSRSVAAPGRSARGGVDAAAAFS